MTGTASALGMAGLAGCTGDPDGSSRDTFKFGVVTSLSGSLRFGGQVTQRGYDLWKNRINEQGGIEVDGERYEVELVYNDAQSDPSTGADAASRMISDENVDALLGPYSSNVSLAVAPITEQNEIPHITGSAETPRLWENQEFSYTFGTVPTVSIIAEEAGSQILSLEPEAESVYITGVSEPFSESTAEAMRTAAEAAGVEVAGFELNPSDADYTNIVSSAQSADPDLHFHGGHVGSHISLLNAAEQLNYSPNGFYCHYGVNTSDFKDGAGGNAQNTFGATVWLPSIEREGGTLFDSSADYVEASQSTFDTMPDYTQAASTAAGIVYQEALGELGSAPPLSDEDKREMVSILESVNIDTFYGPVAFETDGEYYHNNAKTTPRAIQLQENLDPVIVGGESAGEANYPVE
ncbi:amino acid ABC transporter substrate-binding protein [Halobacterium noricense]